MRKAIFKSIEGLKTAYGIIYWFANIHIELHRVEDAGIYYVNLLIELETNKFPKFKALEIGPLMTHHRADLPMALITIEIHEKEKE